MRKFFKERFNARKKNKEYISRILIIKNRYLGDLVSTIPTLATLRKCFKNSEILIIVSKGTEDILLHSGIVDKIITFDRGMVKHPIMKRVIEELFFLFNLLKEGPFDLCIDLSLTERGKLWTLISRASHRVGPGNYFPFNITFNYDNKLHIIERDLNALKAIRIDDFDRKFSLTLSQKDTLTADRFLLENSILEDSFTIFIHPFTRSPDGYRCWPVEKYAELSDLLVETLSAKIIVSSEGSAEEQKGLETFLRITGYKPAIASSMPLGVVGALMKKSKLFIGNDSGPAHLAGALGVPVIAIFGPTDYRLYHPPGESTLIIDKNCKNPCGKKGWDECGGKCLKELTVQEVMDAVISQISRHYPRFHQRPILTEADCHKW